MLWPGRYVRGLNSRATSSSAGRLYSPNIPRPGRRARRSACMARLWVAALWTRSQSATAASWPSATARDSSDNGRCHTTQGVVAMIVAACFLWEPMMLPSSKYLGQHAVALMTPSLIHLTPPSSRSIMWSDSLPSSAMVTPASLTSLLKSPASDMQPSALMSVVAKAWQSSCCTTAHTAPDLPRNGWAWGASSKPNARSMGANWSGKGTSAPSSAW
mmetsp:Transcript_127752/g.361599  ORF Transcript_127752/g.361599 Transcript_127752/m.361599 type:complete len:216 (-) Transcript_127752:51-698(-)